MCPHKWPSDCESVEYLICELCLEDKPCPGCEECAFLRESPLAKEEDYAQFLADNPDIEPRRKEATAKLREITRQYLDHVRALRAKRRAGLQ